MKSWPMIFGTYLGWVGAPTRRKKNSPHVHPKGTCRNFCRKWPKFGQILLLGTQNQLLECAWCVHILHPYFGARYYGVRPKKLPKKFDHTLTQKKVAQAILKFASVGQFPLGFLKGSFLGYFHPWTGWPIFDKAYLYGHGELTNDIWHTYRVGGCPPRPEIFFAPSAPQRHTHPQTSKLAEFRVSEPANGAPGCASGVHIMSALFVGRTGYIRSISYFNLSF